MSYPYIFDLIFGSEKALYYNSIINSFKKHKPIPPPITKAPVGGVITETSSTTYEADIIMPMAVYHNKSMVIYTIPQNGIVEQYNPV